MPENTAPRENLLVNLICNIAVPTYVLTSLSKEEHLGPLWGLVLAILSTLISTMLGTLISLALVRYRFLGRGATNALIFLPMATPELILGASLLTLFVTLRVPLGDLTHERDRKIEKVRG